MFEPHPDYRDDALQKLSDQRKPVALRQLLLGARVAHARRQASHVGDVPPGCAHYVSHFAGETSQNSLFNRSHNLNFKN